MPPLELCLRLSVEGQFATPQHPQLNWTLPHPQALTIGQIIGCNSKNVRHSNNCYFKYWNIFFIDKFCLSLTNKIIMEVFRKFATFCLSCFMLIVSLTKQNSEKSILFDTLCSLTFKRPKTTYNNLLLIEETLLCCINVNLFPTAQSMITIK